VLGWAEFAGLRVAVDRGVFVPRRRTELLVHEAAALARRYAAADGDAGARPILVVDLCCGSGAVGMALDAALKQSARPIELHAADIHPAAVACARRNVAAAGGRVYQGDLYEALPPELLGRVDILIANVPYVPTAEIALLPPEARDYEPRVALDGGADGLDLLRRVAAGAPRWLASGGGLLVETSERQAPAVVQIMTRVGLTARVAESEPLDATAVVATRTVREP
jgi:release factor glutamine methyltransferase